jgi:hypothetical protein
MYLKYAVIGERLKDFHSLEKDPNWTQHVLVSSYFLEIVFNVGHREFKIVMRVSVWTLTCAVIKTLSCMVNLFNISKDPTASILSYHEDGSSIFLRNVVSDI